jgi:hypothetical protein
MKGIFVNRSQRKLRGYAWSKLCDRIKAEVGRVVSFELAQLHSADFRGVRLGRFKSKTKSACEKLGSVFVEGVSGTDVGLCSTVAVPRLSSVSGSAPSPVAAVSLPSKVNVLISSATGVLEDRQSDFFATVVAKGTFMVSAVEDVALPAQVFENPAAPSESPKGANDASTFQRKM